MFRLYFDAVTEEESCFSKTLYLQRVAGLCSSIFTTHSEDLLSQSAKAPDSTLQTVPEPLEHKDSRDKVACTVSRIPKKLPCLRSSSKVVIFQIT